MCYSLCALVNEGKLSCSLHLLISLCSLGRSDQLGVYLIFLCCVHIPLFWGYCVVIYIFPRVKVVNLALIDTICFVLHICFFIRHGGSHFQ